MPPPPPTADEEEVAEGVLDPLSLLVDQEEPLVDTMLPFFGNADGELAQNAARVINSPCSLALPSV